MHLDMLNLYLLVFPNNLIKIGKPRKIRKEINMHVFLFAKYEYA